MQYVTEIYNNNNTLYIKLEEMFMKIKAYYYKFKWNIISNEILTFE